MMKEDYEERDWVGVTDRADLLAILFIFNLIYLSWSKRMILVMDFYCVIIEDKF